ncbi:dicarboxylate/amino acid:cation symporter [Flavobacteriaceae bacterium 3-367]
MISIKPLNDLSVYLSHLVKGRLWLKVTLGILFGVGVGILINPAFGLVSHEMSTTLGSWLNLPGEIFMKLVQMVMIPLIFASIITGLASNVSGNLKSFGLWLLLYFVFTTVVAIFIGVVMAFLFRPGKYVSALGGFSENDVPQAVQESGAMVLNLPESISNLIPVNPLEAILRGEMLSIVIFTIIIGVAITQLEDRFATPVMRFVEAMQKICMIVVGWAMRLVPYAVFGLMAALLSKTGFAILTGLGYYILVVILGLMILMGFYLLLYFLFKRENPFTFLLQIKDAQLLAFSTASSAAVMPLSMKIADEKLGVSSKVSDFVIPIGATINMDGTALFQCVTVLFMAQAYGMELAVFEVLLITVTVVAASIGTPAIPGGGVIVLASVLKSSGIPVEGLVVIIGIDRILGMLRTAVNVTGDLTATAIFNTWYGNTASTN